MQRMAEIPYAPANGVRGLGDLYLPDRPEGAPSALVIHGGGWNAMDKHGLAGVAEFMCEQGFGAYNINYRLLDQAPWPACGDDCLAAARFLLEAGHESMRPLDRRNLTVIGASAGGHLALMTGLRLPPPRVRAIVSIAGPTDLMPLAAKGIEFVSLSGSQFARRFFGPKVEISEELVRKASPIHRVGAKSPRLLTTHSINDGLVSVEHSRQIVEQYRRLGARAELYAYDGPGKEHGIWIEGTDPHRLLPCLEEAIGEFLRTA